MALKNILSAAFVVGLLGFGTAAYSQNQEVKPLFEYPQVPDKLTKINLRSNFMVEHLWDDCDLGKEITNVTSFHETFTDYLSFFIIADLKEVEESVKKFVDRVSKNETNMKNVVSFIDMDVYNPMSQFCSDDVYAIFSRCIVGNKRIDGNVKRTFEINVKKLANSKLGNELGDFAISKGGNAAGSLRSINSEYTVVIMNIDGDFDTSIFKLRLNTDVATNNLIKNGTVSVVSMYSDRTKEKDGDSEHWYTADVAGMEDTFDMRIRPVSYLLDKDKKIVAKSPTIDYVLSVMARINRAEGAQ